VTLFQCWVTDGISTSNLFIIYFAYRKLGSRIRSHTAEIYRVNMTKMLSLTSDWYFCMCTIFLFCLESVLECVDDALVFCVVEEAQSKSHCTSAFNIFSIITIQNNNNNNKHRV